MEAIEFVINYQNYLDEIRQVVKEEYYPVLDSMETNDPHDIIPCDHWFKNENHAKGLVWHIFIQTVKKLKEIHHE
jgi:hypothetical protein